MQIIHFDVDSNIEPLLNEKKFHYSLQKINNKATEFSQTSVVTLTNNSTADAQALSYFPNLKLLVTRTVGTDHIDLEYCKKQRIAVYHIVDYGASNIAEHVFALLLSGTRRVLDSQTEIKKGKFSYEHFIGFTLRDKTLGIIGTGRIGLETIKLAQSFGMKVVAFDVYKNEKAATELGFTYVSLDKLLKKSDVISLHAPLLDSTKHIINNEAIQKMKEGVVLINTARGGLIDNKALINNISQFRFVGLDVLEDEDTFTKNHQLLKYDNVVITPHIAFYTDFTVKKIAEETYKCIENFLNHRNDGKVV